MTKNIASQTAMMIARINQLEAELKQIKAVKVAPVKADPTEKINQARKLYDEVTRMALADVKNPTTGYYKSFTGGVIIKKALKKYGSYHAATEEQTAQTILKAAKEYNLI